MVRRNLKIVFLDFDDTKNPLLGGGQAKVTFEVGKRLTKNGHSIMVLCSKYPGSKDRNQDGIFYKHIGIGSANIRLNNIIYIAVLPFFVHNIKADIIIECFAAPISTLFSPLFTKVPVVGLSTSFEAERFSKLYHLPFTIVEKLGCRFYKYFLAYTPFYESKMKARNKKIVSKIVPCGVEDLFFKIDKRKPKHIMFLGRYDINQKGIDLLLESYAAIKDKIEYPLIIIGVGHDKDKIEKLIGDLKLESYVQLLGPAYGRDKYKYLAESLLVAVPSRSETFSLFTLEALASGSPVVKFDIPGLSWIDKDSALSAKPYDTHAYAKQILALTDQSLVTKMGKNAREFAKNFTWDKVTSMFEDFFLEVVVREAKNV